MLKPTNIVRQWCSKPHTHIRSEIHNRISEKLNSYLGLSTSNNQQEIIPETIHVTVECAGSGKLLNHRLVISEDETVSSLREKIYELLPTNMWYDCEKHKIFIGHEGHELDRIDQINNGDTLVVLPETKDMIEIKNSSDINSISYSPDGKVLASGYDDDTVKLWSTQDGSLIRTLEVNGNYQTFYPSMMKNEVNSVAFSPDSKVLATGSNDSTVKLWSIQDRSLIRTLEWYDGPVLSVAFSPDGKVLASGSGEGTVILWSTQDGSLIRTLEGHEWHVNSVAFSPDGKVLSIWIF